MVRHGSGAPPRPTSILMEVCDVETYRAAIYRHPEGEEQVMTLPEEAHLSDEELIERAMAEANAAGLIGDEWPQVPEEEYRARLYVGEWATGA